MACKICSEASKRLASHARLVMGRDEYWAGYRSGFYVASTTVSSTCTHTDPPEEEKPLPCPFCGKEPGWFFNGNDNRVFCTHQGVTISGKTRGDAIRAWNTRAK